MVDSSEKAPSYSYSGPGTYTVSLEVADTVSNAAAKAKGDYIEVVGPLTVDFLATETRLVVGQGAIFTPNVSGGLLPYSFAWDFDNDGLADSNDEVPIHSYVEPGVYTVRLTVTDSKDSSGFVVKDAYVQVKPTLLIDFSLDKGTVSVGEDITFAPTAGGGFEPYTYEWSFGDGATSTEAWPTHSYAVPGSHTVTLAVVDSAQHRRTGIKQDLVSVGVCGDQNNDGIGTVADVIMNPQIAVALIEPTPSQNILSDLNRDGTVDVLDAIMGLQRIVGIIPSLDACGPLSP